jgi:hypothetical protein
LDSSSFAEKGRCLRRFFWLDKLLRDERYSVVKKSKTGVESCGIPPKPKPGLDGAPSVDTLSANTQIPLALRVFGMTIMERKRK